MTVEVLDADMISPDDLILVTGASGFIGSRVVKQLIDHGFRNLRCLARRPLTCEAMQSSLGRDYKNVQVEIIKGNLLSRSDCLAASKDVAVVYHLAAGRGEKSYSDAFLNSVVTTRNLLDALRQNQCLKRFVTVSTFSVYSNQRNPHGRVLDESCRIERSPQKRGDAYTFAKSKQDELVIDYGKTYGIPYVIVRPGVVYGPGNEGITGRVGIGTFGLFLHLGGSNPIPFTYVENCAEAIVLAGLRPGIDGEVYNVVDDPILSSRDFLRLYKRNVQPFKSVYVPHVISYILCYLWEKYSAWSEGQLAPVFNRAAWHAYWKRTFYTNEKIKTQLGWVPKVSASEALSLHFASCRRNKGLA